MKFYNVNLLQLHNETAVGPHVYQKGAPLQYPRHHDPPHPWNIFGHNIPGIRGLDH